MSTSDYTIEEFCDRYYACHEGRTWAIENCKDMREAWDKAPEPRWVLWIATRPGVLTLRELQKFALWCAENVRHLMKDKRSTDALDVVAKYLRGEATVEELKTARVYAYAAYAYAYATWDAWTKIIEKLRTYTPNFTKT